MGYTKRDKARSDELAGALSPTQINRLTSADGFGLPTGTTWLEFGSALASVTGRGRNPLDVAAVRLADEHGWYTERLRRVLLAPATEERAELLFGDLLALATKAARAEVAAGRRPDEEAYRRQEGGVIAALEEQAQITVDTLRADLEDTWEGDNEATFEDGAQVSRRIAISLNGPPDSGREEVYADEFGEWMRTFAARLRGGQQWAKEAPANELVASVQLAATLWRSTVLHKLPLSEEDSWRMIAALAQCMSVLVDLAHEVQSQIAAGHAIPPARPPLEA